MTDFERELSEEYFSWKIALEEAYRNYVFTADEVSFIYNEYKKCLDLMKLLGLDL